MVSRQSVARDEKALDRRSQEKRLLAGVSGVPRGRRKGALSVVGLKRGGGEDRKTGGSGVHTYNFRCLFLDVFLFAVAK